MQRCIGSAKGHTDRLSMSMSLSPAQNQPLTFLTRGIFVSIDLATYLADRCVNSRMKRGSGKEGKIRLVALPVIPSMS
jgi:hypothetical protein